MDDEVDSIGARLWSESESAFDRATRCITVESSGDSKVGLLLNETATLDRNNACADNELTTSVADVSGSNLFIASLLCIHLSSVVEALLFLAEDGKYW